MNTDVSVEISSVPKSYAFHGGVEKDLDAFPPTGVIIELGFGAVGLGVLLSDEGPALMLKTLKEPREIGTLKEIEEDLEPFANGGVAIRIPCIESYNALVSTLEMLKPHIEEHVISLKQK